jgi:hypothetical protein
LYFVLHVHCTSNYDFICVYFYLKYELPMLKKQLDKSIVEVCTVEDAEHLHDTSRQTTQTKKRKKKKHPMLLRSARRALLQAMTKARSKIQNKRKMNKLLMKSCV